MRLFPVAELARLAALALVTFVALDGAWAFASTAAADAAARPVVAVVARVAPVPRSLTRSVPSDSPALLRVVAPGAPLARQTVVQEPLAFETQIIADAELLVGRVVVVTPGVPGLVERTYQARLLDGEEVDRTLVASFELAPPVAEVRRVGSKPPPVPSEIEALIRSAAADWGAEASQLLRVAWCESRYNPAAYNARSGASGLFQFLPRTWAANSVRAGYAGASVFDAVANANTAAYMFRNGQAWQWACK